MRTPRVIPPIKDATELLDILTKLRKFDLRVYLIAYISLHTYEDPKNLYNLKVKDLVQKKEYISSSGYTLTFNERTKDIIYSLASGKTFDDPIFVSLNGNPFNTQQLAKRFYDFKAKTNISLSATLFQRTFIYNHFITTGKFPDCIPNIFKKDLDALLKVLNINKQEYEEIASGNVKTSIFALLEDTGNDPVLREKLLQNKCSDKAPTYIKKSGIDHNNKKRFFRVEQFNKTTLTHIEEKIDDFTDDELLELNDLLYPLERKLTTIRNKYEEICNKRGLL